MLAFRLWPARAGSLSAARRKRWVGVAAVGLLLTTLAYTLSYFHLDFGTGFPLSGRDTRVSGAASIGSSILAAAVLMWIGESRSRVRRTASRTLTAGVLLLLFLYALVVQDDYAVEWRHQREFLTQAILLSPDIQNDTLFVVRTDWVSELLFPRGARRLSIGFSRHGLQVSMQALFGEAAPRVFFVYGDQWPQYLKLHSDQKLYWTRESFPGGWARNTNEPITPGHVITMREDDRGVLQRSDAPVWVDGRQIVQIARPPAGVKPESNWPFLKRTPLLRKIVPDYVMTSAMSHLTGVPAPPPVRIPGGVTLAELESAGPTARIEKGPPARIVTPPNSGHFAAGLSIHTPRDLFGARYAYLRARVVRGRIGVWIVDAGTRMMLGTTLDVTPAAADTYLPIVEPNRADKIILYNAAANGSSEILIEEAAVVVSAPPAGDR
jgi:hypothetical protein